MNSSVKLLLIVREPVTRAISDYTQLKSHAATATIPSSPSSSAAQQSSVSPITKWVIARDSIHHEEQHLIESFLSSSLSRSFEELAILPNGTVNEAYRPLVISMYHLHVHRWLEVFSREQLLIVNGDQLIEDPVSQIRRIEDFLGEYLSYIHF